MIALQSVLQTVHFGVLDMVRLCTLDIVENLKATTPEAFMKAARYFQIGAITLQDQLGCQRQLTECANAHSEGQKCANANSEA